MAPVEEQATDESAGRAGFPPTHWSVVVAARCGQSPAARDALERLCQAYWPPLYAYVCRCGYQPHDAQDLTQEFFARLLARDFLDTVRPEKGKFRSFLLASMNHFLSNERAKRKAAKRTEEKTIAWDPAVAEAVCRVEGTSDLSPERTYDRRWAQQILERAFAAMQAEYETGGQGPLFAALCVFLEDATARADYVAVAEQLKTAPKMVALKVHRLRKRFRELVRLEVAETVTTAGQVEEEMSCLFEALRAG